MPMDIEAISALKSASVLQQAAVTVQVGATKQAETVVKQILEGIPQSAPGKGENVNVVA